MRKMTDQGRITPIYFPTTVAVVDDEPYYLQSLNSILSPDICYLPCKTASSALSRLDNSSNDSHFISKTRAIDLNGIVCDSERFNPTTVLVVDYAMPDMNGLTVCKNITNPYIKKILLTGVANQHVGDQALKDNVIDFFLRKDDSECTQKLNTIINDYQYEHCTNQYANLSDPVRARCAFISDSTFIHFYFSPMLQQYNIVEYYFEQLYAVNELSGIPWSFILIDYAGTIYRMNIFTDKIIKDLSQRCRLNNVPDEIIRLIEDKKQLINITKPNGQHCTDIVDWYNYLESAVTVTGKEKYYCTLSPIPAETLDKNNSIYSYKQHLTSHEQNDGFRRY